MVLKKRVIYFNFNDYFICYFLNYPILMGLYKNKKQLNKRGKNVSTKKTKSN